MAGLFLEQANVSQMLTCCGVQNNSLYFVHENVIEFVETQRQIKLPCNIKWAVSDGCVIYALTEKDIYKVKPGTGSSYEMSSSVFDLCDIPVKNGYFRDNKIFILSENEVIVYDVQSEETFRYVPYGHKILCMDLCYTHSNEFVLLLSSHNQNVIRTISVRNGLEEVAQFSVPSSVHMIYSLLNKSMLLIEPDKISLHNSSSITHSMCFNAQVVRTGIILNNVCVLSLLTNELCYIDIDQFLVVNYIKPGIISEGMLCIREHLYLYNKIGDICVVDIKNNISHIVKTNTGVTALKKGYKLTGMKIQSSGGCERIQLLTQRSKSIRLEELTQKYKEYTNKLEIEEKPVQILSNGVYSVVRYIDRLNIIDKRFRNESVVFSQDIIMCSVSNASIYYLNKSGVLSAYKENKTSGVCLFCGDSGISSETNKNHTQACLGEVFFADMHNNLLVCSTTKGIYLANAESGMSQCIGEYNPISLRIYKETVVIGDENESTVIHINNNLEVTKQHSIPIAGGTVVPISAEEYLLHKYNGSLWYIHNDSTKTQNIRIGTAVIKGISYLEDKILIITDSNSILLDTCRSTVNAQLIDSRNKHGISCIDTDSNEYQVYRYNKNLDKHYIAIYKLVNCPVYSKKSVVRNGCIKDNDIVDAINIKKYRVIISKSTALVKETVLSNESSIKVSLYNSNGCIHSVSYNKVYSTHCIGIGNRLYLAINKEDRSEILTLKIKKNAISQIESAPIESSITGISVHKGILCCCTTVGVILLRMHKFRLIPVGKNTLHTYSNGAGRCEVRDGYLVEYVLFHIILHRIILDRGTVRLEKSPLVYVDRVKSRHKVVRMLNDKYFVIGYAHETSGSIILLKRKENTRMHVVLSFSLPSGVIGIEKTSLSLINRSDTLFILTETGSIYRMELIDDNVISALVHVHRNSSPSEKNEIQVFAKEDLFPIMEVKSHANKKVILSSEPDKITSLSISL
ncbi:hypothetical protein NEQG_00812 [Nematocida parisii ERTm3]|uniref:Uncharacterized protein n=1 Tax=Nematocida parisii (strain ERTm3) TaxID=935791 RepID=I3EIE6_NEMP3|nr:hypothetical protein NEQG_00812 [Nematocida parisii ERTm3]